MTDPSTDPGRLPHVVIVGGGFGGLYAAKALKNAPVQVTVVDRRNHHLFQPLLYQVATASLSPANIAAPIRRVLRGQKNTVVILGEAVGVDVENRVLRLADGQLSYDTLLLACGATHSYFGKSQWEALAPGLKTVEDALEIRRRFLLAFEAAERATDPVSKQSQLTFVVVGGGPTGVELAGAMIEIARRAIPRDFRSVDTATARVILVEAADRVLPGFPPVLSAKAKADLERLGVEVRVNSRVTEIDGGGVMLGQERVKAVNVIWAAGVQASPLGASLRVPLDRAGRVIVGPDLSIPGHPEVFVIGDMACMTDATSGRPVPGICPAAIQTGKYVARLIHSEAASRRGGLPATGRPRFHYIDKGILATIGRNKAVAALRSLNVSGVLAWLLWALVHIFFLIGFRNRILVMLEWAWVYFLFDRGARLITGESRFGTGDRAPPLPPPSSPGSAPA